MKRVLGAVVLVALVAGAAAIGPARDGLGVATGYAAKLTCSLTLNSGLAADVVARDLLDHVLWPVSRRLAITAADCCASASAFGVRSRAVRRRGLGCTLLAGREERSLAQPELPPAVPPLGTTAPWPLGDAPLESPAPPAVAAAVDEAFREPADASRGRVRQTRAVLVAHRGRLLAERYADGYSAATPMISWSMAKSVTAALVGIAVADGRLDLDAAAPVPEWSGPGDPRRAITLDQLLRMSSGLRFDETYGAVNDVSRMLFLEPDAAAFAASFPLQASPGSAWSYSSGTSNLVARALFASVGGEIGAFVRFARERLFEPASIRSAFFEHDAAGTPVGSSFVFMTARDWARFGELHRRDGVWDGRRVLPEGWVRYVTTPTAHAPDGRYGAHWWLNAGDAADRERRPWPSLPPDAYAARGYSGQWVLVVPSRELVIVRLGMAFPDDGDDGAAELARAVIAALDGA